MGKQTAVAGEKHDLGTLVAGLVISKMSSSRHHERPREPLSFSSTIEPPLYPEHSDLRYSLLRI